MNKSFLCKFICMLLLIVTISGGCVFARSSNAKKVYSTALSELGKSIKGYNEVSSFTTFNSGKKTVKSSDKEDNYEVLFDGAKYFIQTNNFNALFDDDKDDLFIQKKENGKKVGEVLKAEKENSYGYQHLDYTISSNLYRYLLDIDSTYTDNQASLYNAYAILVENIGKALNESWFSENKVNGITEYTLTMGDKEVKEFVSSYFKELKKNKEFIKILNDMGDSEEEINESFNEIINSVNDIKGFSLKMSIYTKGLLTKFVGFKADMNVEDVEFSIDLNSKELEELSKCENIVGKLSMKNGAEEMTYDFSANQEKVVINGQSKTKKYRYFYDSSNEYEVSSFRLSLFCDVGKNIIDSSNIVVSYLFMEANNSREAELNIKGDSEDGVLKSKNVVVSYKIDDEEAVEFIRFRAEDDKTFEDSQNIIMELFIDGDEVIFDLKANDSKPIFKSSNLSLSIQNSFFITIKALDNKSFTESKNVEIDVNGQYDYDNIDMKVVLKGDKKFSDCKKLNIAISGSMEGQDVNVDGTLESKSNAPLAKSSKFKANAKIKSGSKEIEIKAENGKYFEYTERDNEDKLYKTTKLEQVNNVNIDKMMNTNKAKEASIKDIMSILNPKMSEVYELEEKRVLLEEELYEIQFRSLTGMRQPGDNEREKELKKEIQEIDNKIDKIYYRY